MNEKAMSWIEPHTEDCKLIAGNKNTHCNCYVALVVNALKKAGIK